jgi:hypothetical protein
MGKPAGEAANGPLGCKRIKRNEKRTTVNNTGMEKRTLLTI